MIFSLDNTGPLKNLFCSEQFGKKKDIYDDVFLPYI